MPAGVAAAAVRKYDAALARMGSDVCIYSLELAIDEIAGEVTADPRESDALRASLRTRAGLSTA
ncbi:MAG: hypothetical protein ACTHNU_11050 [Gaiellales bacterium]